MYKIAENPKSNGRLDEISEPDKSAKGGICARKTSITSEHGCSVDGATCCISKRARCSETFTASTNKSTHSALCVSSKKFSLLLYLVILLFCESI